MPCVIGTVGTGDKTTRGEKASCLVDLDSAKTRTSDYYRTLMKPFGHIAKLKREEKERLTACEASSRGENYMSLWAQWKRLEVHRGLLYRRWMEENKPDILQLVLHQPAVRKGTSPKLYRAWDGPYIVKTIISDVVYRIQRESPKQKRIIVHFNRLKSCSLVLREPPSTTDREGTDVSENLSPEKDLGPSLLPRSSSLDFSYKDETKTNSPELFVLPMIIPERRYPARQRKPMGYFLETWEKVNVSFNENGTVSFHQRKVFQFDPKHSKGDVDDMVVIPNIPMLSATSQSKHAARFLRLAMASIMDILKIKPFVEVSVHQLLWGYEDPLLKLAKDVVPKDQKLPYDEFGLMYGVTMRGTIQARTGPCGYSWVEYEPGGKMSGTQAQEL
uniref:Scavenger receptor class B member 1 n=1 Tax=Timema monikensis TaxID=170555 RepID=A0A7R9EHT0_9NEOP|nr:unnamed protein product [Timema monikensis]